MRLLSQVAASAAKIVANRVGECFSNFTGCKNLGGNSFNPLPEIYQEWLYLISAIILKSLRSAESIPCFMFKAVQLLNPFQCFGHKRRMSNVLAS